MKVLIVLLAAFCMAFASQRRRLGNNVNRKLLGELQQTHNHNRTHGREEQKEPLPMRSQEPEHLPMKRQDQEQQQQELHSMRPQEPEQQQQLQPIGPQEEGQKQPVSVETTTGDNAGAGNKLKKVKSKSFWPKILQRSTTSKGEKAVSHVEDVKQQALTRADAQETLQEINDQANQFVEEVKLASTYNSDQKSSLAVFGDSIVKQIESLDSRMQEQLKHTKTKVQGALKSLPPPNQVVAQPTQKLVETPRVNPLYRRVTIGPASKVNTAN